MSKSKELHELESNTFQLPNKKVLVKPNLANPGWVKNHKSPAFFKMEGTYDRLMCTMLRNGQLANPLTKEEKELLERELFMEPNELSIHKKGNDNFWSNTTVALGRDTVTLDLSNPMDYIKYKILLTNKFLVGKNATDARMRKCKYYIEDPSDVQKEIADKTNYNKVAWTEYGKMENKKDALRNFLIVFNITYGNAVKKLDKDTDLVFLQKEVSNIIETRIKDFVNLVERKDYLTRVLIAEGVQSGVIAQKGLKYFVAESDQKLGDSLKETVDILENPANQELRLRIEENIKLT